MTQHISPARPVSVMFGSLVVLLHRIINQRDRKAGLETNEEIERKEEPRRPLRRFLSKAEPGGRRRIPAAD
jgi:hypothetical protein